MIKDISKIQINLVTGGICVIKMGSMVRFDLPFNFKSKGECIDWCRKEDAEFYIFSEETLDSDQAGCFLLANFHKMSPCSKAIVATPALSRPNFGGQGGDLSGGLV